MAKAKVEVHELNDGAQYLVATTFQPGADREYHLFLRQAP